MVETVLFDLDNTLLDFNQAEKTQFPKHWSISISHRKLPF